MAHHDVSFSLSCCSVKLKKSNFMIFQLKCTTNIFRPPRRHVSDETIHFNLNGVRDTHSVSCQWLIQNDDDACWICYWARLRFSEYFFLCFLYYFPPYSMSVCDILLINKIKFHHSLVEKIMTIKNNRSPWH